MFMLTACTLLLAIGINGHDHYDKHEHHPGAAMPANPVPPILTMPPVMEPGEEYKKMRHHTILTRDHGCAELPDKIEESFACVYIGLKNRYSDAGVKPSQFLTEFQYHSTHNSWRPVVTWVERIEAKYVRACAASVPGKKEILGEGKIRWLALYNYTQSAQEQGGVLTFKSLQQQQVFQKPFTANKHCFLVQYPMAFSSAPTVKFTLKLNNGYHSAQDAMVIWAKGTSSSEVHLCVEEFHAWARYHTEYEIHWHGLANGHSQDEYSSRGVVSFNANEALSANHGRMLDYYCKNVTLPNAYYPCHTILLQPVEPSLDICESALVAWVAYTKGNMASVCYADRRGIVAQRPVQVDIHYMVYGLPDKCVTHQCPANQECIHPTYNTVACGCIKSCDAVKSEVCGTNMKTYVNRCTLDKESCESGYKFKYAHKGPCEKFTYDHGRQQLQSVSGCDGLYCTRVSTRNSVWYEDAEVHVQISTSWGNIGEPHDASASWVEDVKPTGFRACVMQGGRQTLQQGPSIHWFAYQGELEEVKSHRIEVGDWHSGTHCVPVHERKHVVAPSQFTPNVCPSINLKDIGKVDKDRWQYDAHLMSQIYGQHHHEWFKRMMMGYGIKKMKLTNGMEVDGMTFMMTVEHTKQHSTRENLQDAVNVWMEYDARTKESYVCLREMQNWDGKHDGIHVHWTLFNKTTIRNFGFSHKVVFKPQEVKKNIGNQAVCQYKPYLPEDMNLIAGTGATVLVSLAHKITPYSAMDSMKKYKMHHMEMKKGMSMGEVDFGKSEVRESWTFPHMWRANLTGWRPHMRINKDTDYSAWIEGMNATHIQVCQKSLSSGHFEGVQVNLFVIPDRCPVGYRFFKGGYCGKFVSQCANVNDAAAKCQSEGAWLGCPEECRDAVWMAYLAGQANFHVSLTDAAQEQNWVRSFGNPSTSNYFRWGSGQPSSQPNAQGVDSLDCAYQTGRNGDFTMHTELCSSCKQYVCVRAAPWLSCNFRKPDYCNDCGICKKNAPHSFSCSCIPPYAGGRCETRQPKADQ